jgi:uncharacterized RDD family membrane protein YckC
VATDGSVEYAGFWIRVGAALIDTLLVLCITYPILVWIYGWSYFSRSGFWFAGTADFVLSWLLPAAAVIAFWVARQATPGKLALHLRVVDAKNGGRLSIGQSIGRYLGYYVSIFPFCLGLIWVGIDSRKQGFHDKLAGTVVIRTRRGTEPVRFEGA